MTTPDEPIWHQFYRLEGGPEYTPQLGILAAMLAYARMTTLEAVAGLSAEQLDAVPPGFSNSIGVLLAHIAAVDRLYQALSFEGRDLDLNNPQEAAWDNDLQMGKLSGPARGRELDAYLADLAAARAVTLAEFARRDDAWLASRLTAPDFGHANQHWAWFHVMEDEVSHRGQMRVIRGALGIPHPERG